MALLIDGKKVSNEILSDLKIQTQRLIAEKGIRPGLALLLVGDNPASKIYVNSKRKACEEIGFFSIVEHLPENTSESEVLSLIAKWNSDSKIHGILVQLPLPNQIDPFRIILSIKPSKDVDGFHPENFGRLVIGLPGFSPCTPMGIVELFNYYNIDTDGKHVVVVGRSNIVGKPIANMLYQKRHRANAIVTICHTHTKDLRYFTRQADIIISAIGIPNRFGADDIKEGAVVIDVGINRIEDKNEPKGYRIVGDVNFKEVEPRASAITPVPGGVGPMTIAMLMQNTYYSAINAFQYET
ncbi:MAG: bifunctional methylenetetrahydrofolate dehydrogenase/methenyltetrahydrofolate cyclohydrolase FolD [Candidatus Kapaibacteriales bacterium]